MKKAVNSCLNSTTIAYEILMYLECIYEIEGDLI